MRLYCVLIFLLIGLTIFIGCGEESANDDDDGDPDGVADIHGIVANKETDEPIANASVNIGGEIAQTDNDGKYILEGLLLAENIEIVVTVSDYVEYKGIITLDRELMILNIDLVPVDSQTARVLEVLESLSRDLEALDLGKIPDLQLYLSEDYAAAQDATTAVGISAGVVPIDYAGFPETIETIVGKYDKLEFTFANSDVELDGDSATVLMRIAIYAETKPNPPATPAKKWELIVDGKLNFQKENGDWRIIYWQLIPPFLKFLEEPLVP